MVLVDFGRKKRVWSILTGKTGFARFWPKNVIVVDSGSFGVIWGHLGFPNEFFEFEIKVTTEVGDHLGTKTQQITVSDHAGVRPKKKLFPRKLRKPSRIAW